MTRRETFERKYPSWRDPIAEEFRAAADRAFARGQRIHTNADVAEVRHGVEVTQLNAMRDLSKQMGPSLVEEACAIAADAFVQRLLELQQQPYVTTKH